MTVGIAALHRWVYSSTAGPPEDRHAALVISDRMITFGDSQYEPQQSKIAVITPRVLIAIAGDYSVHTQAIKRTMFQFRNTPEAMPEQIALFYGRAIQQIKLKEAEDIYLAPIGLNSDSFLAQQKDMAPHFVSLLTDQMQGYKGEDVDTLVVGGDGTRVEIWHIDTRGIITSADDVGFAAIGSGSWHARSRLMQVGYTNNVSFSEALAFTFAAKKAAEVAPGVGSTHTDFHIVFRHGIEKLVPDVAEKVSALYNEYRPRADALGIEYIGRLDNYLSTTPRGPDGLPKISGGDAQTDESTPQPSAETSREDETGEPDC